MIMRNLENSSSLKELKKLGGYEVVNLTNSRAALIKSGFARNFWIFPITSSKLAFCLLVFLALFIKGVGKNYI